MAAHSTSERGLRIFVSYRHRDVSRYVDRLHERLLDAFGREAVFMDAGGARTRAEFSVALDEALMQCDVMLVLIDRNWPSAASKDDTRSGLPGVLDEIFGDLVREGMKEVIRGLRPDRDEFVQLELESAIRQGVRVIAVLVDGADMPAPEDLPPSMAGLVRADARHLSRRRWRSDLRGLIEELKTWEGGEQRRGARVNATRAPREVCRLIHDGRVTSVAFSDDGTRLATGGRDKTARIWDPATGEELVRLDHEGFRVRYVSSVAFSPDGIRLATGTGDKRARIWDVASGTELLRVSHRNPLRSFFSGPSLMSGTSVTFGADGSRLLTGAGTSAWIWDAVTGEKLRRIPPGFSADRNFSVAFTGDGARTVTGGDQVRVWDSLSGELVCVVPASAHSLAFSPDGRRIATTGLDLAVLWDAGTREKLFRVPFNSLLSSPVVFSSDGTRIAMGTLEVVEVWDAVMGRRLFHLNQERPAVSVAFSPDGTRLATAAGRAAHVWAL